MCNPVAQEYGSLSLCDDPAIGSMDRVIRYCRTPAQIVPDGKGGMRLSDRAFAHKPQHGGTSVDLECLMLRDGVDPLRNVGLLPNTFAVVALSAGDIRSVAQGVAYTPKHRDDSAVGYAREPNAYHADIIGPITSSISKKLLKHCSIVIPIRDDLLPLSPSR